MTDFCPGGIHPCCRKHDADHAQNYNPCRNSFLVALLVCQPRDVSSEEG